MIDDLYALVGTFNPDRLRARLLEPEGQRAYIEILLTDRVDAVAVTERVPVERLVKEDFGIALIGQNGGSTFILRASIAGRLRSTSGGSDIPLHNSLEYLTGRIGTDVNVMIHGTVMKVSILSPADAMRTFERQALKDMETRKTNAVLDGIERWTGNLALMVTKAP